MAYKNLFATETVKYIWTHPNCSETKIQGILKFISWQLYKRLTKKYIDLQLVDSIKIRCHPDSRSAAAALYCGLYDYHDMNFLLRYLRAEDSFLDIGANIGIYTLLAASIIKSGIIYSFEALPKNYTRLEENLKINQLEQVKTYLLACHRKIVKNTVFGFAGLLLILFSIIPIRMAIASYQNPAPQAIITLGGGIEREKFTATFAQKHPHLDIYISSGIPPQEAITLFKNAAIPNTIYLDYRAVDTVTNFTTLVNDFQHRHIQHIYLITSDFHLPRAKIIATLVLGSRGITFTPISIPSQYPRESIIRIARDSGRCLLWIILGRTGASFNPRFHPPSYYNR